jgi:hypothetical protein
MKRDSLDQETPVLINAAVCRCQQEVVVPLFSNSVKYIGGALSRTAANIGGP